MVVTCMSLYPMKMTHTRAVFALASFVSITVSGWAADWVPTGPNGFVDVGSIVRVGPVVQAWRKVVYENGVDMPTIVGRTKVKTLLILVEFNCDRRTYRTVEAEGFVGLSTSDIGLKLQLPKDTDHVRPESGVEREMTLACTAK
jgi:hypothetical protein